MVETNKTPEKSPIPGELPAAPGGDTTNRDLNDWKTALTSNHPKATWEVYIRHVDGVIVSSGKRSPRTIDAADVQKYINPLEPSAQETALASVNSYLATAERHISKKQLQMKTKPMPREIHALTPWQVREVAGLISDYELRTLWLLAYETGFRVSDLIGLTVQDIELGKKPKVQALTMKNKCYAPPPISITMADLLRPLLDGKAPTDRVFTVRRRQAVWEAFHKAGEDAHIPTAVYPHLCRHMRGQADIEAGVPLPVICKTRGWKNSKFVIERYGQPSADKSTELARKSLTPLPEKAPMPLPAREELDKRLLDMVAQGLLTPAQALQFRADPERMENEIKKKVLDPSYR
jgi:integrase